MHSLAWLVVVGGVVLVEEVRAAALPVITPAPSVEDVALLAKRQDPDAISLAQVLLTAVPASLRQIAATNIPAVSSILFDQFLDDNRPEWFEELPEDIQEYLIGHFGPHTAQPTNAPATTNVDASTTAYPTESWAPIQSSFEWPSPSGTSEDASQATSATKSVGSIHPTRSSASSDSTSKATPASSRSSTLATSASRSSVHSSATASHTHALSSSLNLSKPSSSPSSTSEPDAPPASDSGLTRKQKIGLGVGIPFAILGAAAFAFGCCTLLRRRKKKHDAGSIPPSSPGFIPRFAFHERSTDNLEHRTSLIQAANRSTHDLRGSAWEDDGIDPMESAMNPYAMNNPYTMSTPYTMNDVGTTSYTNTRPSMTDPAPIHHPPSTGMATHDATPIMAPALFHTHSSNRARGMRTSYTSLQSVTEVTEPDDLESPVLGRDATKHLNPPPVIPAAAQIKRKPIPASPPSPSPLVVSQSSAAQEAAHKLRRQTMPEHSGSSSSGLALSTSTGKNTSTSSGLAAYPDTESPISPISNHRPSNPFNYDSYVEDYGPEYHNGYVDVDDGLYGGNTSLSRYPEPRRKSSKTEWPLRSMVGSLGHQRRKSSPLWDRISEE